MIVQLQAEDEDTCVSCSAINALRHYGLGAPPVDVVVEALRLPRGKGSRVIKAAKYLMKEHGMEAIPSRPPFKITDHYRAAEEAGSRWAALLEQGFVGILHRASSSRYGHAVVVYRARQVDGQWLLDTYDSAARSHRGYHTYRAIDYVWSAGIYSMTRWLKLDPKPPDVKPAITGRVAWFVRPYRYVPGANGPPER